MSRMVVAKISLSKGKLPNGKLLGFVGDPAGRVDYALMFVSEEMLDHEILTGKYAGFNLYKARTNQAIPEDEVKNIGDYLGTVGDAHYFIWTGDVP